MTELTELERPALVLTLAIVFGVGAVLTLGALGATRRARRPQVRQREPVSEEPVEPPPL